MLQTSRDQTEFFTLIADISSSFVLSPAAELDHIINQALCRIGQFFQADRCYLFQFDQHLAYAANTHEWCATGVTSQKEALQKLPTSTFGHWFTTLSQSQAIPINDISQLDPLSDEYQLLAVQGIQSVLMLPLVAHGSFLGMFGIDLVSSQCCWTEQHISAMSLIAGNISGSLLRQRAEQKAESLAFYDPVTQLPNRRLILDRLQQTLANINRQHSYAAVLFIDLDNFKHFNDSHGHEQGDLLLRQVATALQQTVRDGDTVGRFGADEFVLIIEQLAPNSAEAAEAVKRVAQKVMQAVQQPYQWQHIRYHNSVSIGASLFNDQHHSADMLITQADMAMYQAKAAGRSCLYFYDATLQQKANQRSVLDNELRQAIKAQQFELFYQLQVDASGMALGAEALIRWQHPQRGLVAPVEFISFAEESGLIVAIGEWVLQAACQQLTLWQQHASTACLTLSVNISASQFQQPDFVSRVSSILQHSGARACKLKLELTESLLIINIGDVIEKMQQLAALGVSFALDDFGTGYSSLAYLKRLPLTQLKIDRSFVRDILIDSNDEAIARMVIALGNTLGLEVLAEGVETLEQLAALQQLGCYQYQGYWFGKPLPIDAFYSALQQLVLPST